MRGYLRPAEDLGERRGEGEADEAELSFMVKKVGPGGLGERVLVTGGDYSERVPVRGGEGKREESKGKGRATSSRRREEQEPRE